jgi:hypothetical protein
MRPMAANKLVHAENYRTLAVCPEIKPKVVFSYYKIEKRGARLTECPVCEEAMYESSGFSVPLKGRPCYPTRRLVVKGFWFWRKYCPLPGTHIHFKCPICDAVSVRFYQDPPSPVTLYEDEDQ